MNVSMGSGRIVNISPLRRRSPPGWPATSNVICHTRTRNAAGADATVHISDLLARRATGPSERHARRDRPPPSIDRWTGQLSTNAPLAAPAHSARRTPEPIRSGRGGAGLRWGGAGTLSRVAEGEVREDRPDDRGIVQRGDQP